MADEFARRLRREMTEAERRLWYHLRHRQLGGAKFRRQVPIGRYIVDFACLQDQLVIELDGGQHAAAVESDVARTAWLESRGYRVLRFWNHEVFEDPGCVLESIGLALRPTPHPNPPPQGGRGSQVAAAEDPPDRIP